MGSENIDDASRLRFADSVEASDPRRARFIRLSCAYARTPATEAEHAVLEAGLARCMPVAAWHADLAGIPGISWAYDRGFVGFLRAPADVLVREAASLLAHPIDTLVAEVKARDAAALVASGVLARIRSLTLLGPTKAQREVLASNALGSLRKLVLVTDEKGIDALVDLPVLGRLESLDLQLRGDVAEALARLAGAGPLPRLDHLEIRADPTSIPIDVTPLAGSSIAAGLRSLVLGSLDDPEGARVLGDLEALQSLEVWDLGEAAGPVLCSGPLVGRLERLKLQHPSRSAIVALAGNPGATALRRLELGGFLQTVEVVGDEGVEALARSPHLAGLVALDLGGCAMGPRGAEALADSAAFPKLRVLNLQRRNHLGVTGVKALSRWSSLRGVHTLYLPLEEPEPAAVLAPLLESGSLHRVRRLDLWGPEEEGGDAVVEALVRADLPVLSHLAMAHAPSFRSRGAKALLSSGGLPELAILWARLKKVPKAARLALGERYLVFDSEWDSGLDSPLGVYHA